MSQPSKPKKISNTFNYVLFSIFPRIIAVVINSIIFVETKKRIIKMRKRLKSHFFVKTDGFKAKIPLIKKETNIKVNISFTQILLFCL